MANATCHRRRHIGPVCVALRFAKGNLHKRVAACVVRPDGLQQLVHIEAEWSTMMCRPLSIGPGAGHRRRRLRKNSKHRTS